MNESQRFRARVALHDLAGAGERRFDSAEAMLSSENARAAVIEAIDEASAEGTAEAEIEAELRTYRAEQFTLEKSVRDLRGRGRAKAAISGAARAWLGDAPRGRPPGRGRRAARPHALRQGAPAPSSCGKST